MQQRKALIVTGAAGPQDIANGVLQRFGFAPAVLALSLAEAVARLHGEHFDLLVVSLQGIASTDLTALEREVRRQRTTFVIGTATQADPDLILRAMRSGIHEFLVYPPDPKDFAGAVDRLMRRTHSDAKGGTAIAVYSAKGGVGTTSMAVNLAFSLAKTHPNGRVALADLVASGGDVRVMLDLKPTYDMGDLIRKVDRIDAELLQSVLTPCAGGVWALPSAEDPEVAEAFDAAAATSIVEQLRSHFTFTVIDCEHHMSERTLAALDAADRVVIVTQLNVPALRSTQRTLALCQRLGYAADKLHVVVNRHQSSDVVSIADATQVLGCEIFFKIPNDYRTSAAALTRGVPVAEQDAASALARSYTALAAKLDGGADAPLRNDTNASRNGSRLGRLLSLGRK
jgi:pilus assembly protein CpaE